MLNNVSVTNMLNSIVPISRFNKGEANKIFDEVNKTGCKIVVKNNKPTCVLITPEAYQDMVEEIEDLKLCMETERRIKNGAENDCISQEEIRKEFGITQEDLDAIEDVEIE